MKPLMIVGIVGGAVIANYFITKSMNKTFLWQTPKPSATEVAGAAVAAASQAGVDGFNNAIAERTNIFTRSGFTMPGMGNGGSRIKPFGGKMQNGQKMCFDTGSGTYVPCSQASSVK